MNVITVEGIAQGRSVEQMENELLADEVAEQISQLIGEYAFPLEVLQDVNHRLADCYELYYAKQQLRYLQNIVKAGCAVKRKGHDVVLNHVNRLEHENKRLHKASEVD